MSDSKLPLDLTGLSAPATKLIEVVSNAIGVVYEPTRIRRKAKAEADAALVLARNKEEVTDIELRATKRLVTRELRRQENIENITRKALDALPPNVSEKPVDPDWTFRFFEACEDISNDEMQTLWAKLLAGEVASPGKFSSRTVRVVRDLGAREANLFTTVCTYLWNFPSHGLLPAMPEVDSDRLKGQGLDLPSLFDLGSLGLLEINTVAGFSLNNVSGPMLTNYFDKPVIIQSQSYPASLQLGKVLLTSVGRELAPISGAVSDDGYFLETIDGWRKAGLSVSEVQLHSPGDAPQAARL